MKKTIFIVAAVMISGPLLSQRAKDTTALVSDPIFTDLTPAIVTAHKSDQRQLMTGKVVNVIPFSVIDKSRGRTLSEVLNTVPGVSINGANNNPGTNQTVNIRGASAGNALILIDGIPVNDPSVITNYYDLNLITLDQVERIEILKGGQSTLYGSDAVAGVINIITKKASQLKSLTVNGGFSGGSYATFRNNIGVIGANKDITYKLQYSDVFSQGFSSAYDSTGNKNFDNDGYRQNVLTGNFQWKMGKNWVGKINGLYSGYKTDVDAGAFTDDKDYTSKSTNWQGGAGLTYKLVNGNINANYLYNDVKRTYTDDSSDRANTFAYYANSTYTGITHFAELYGTFKWQNVELLSGIDFRQNKTNQDYFSLGIFGPYSSSLKDTLANMWQLSPYASVILKNNKGASVEGGIRWNYHSEYGNNFTYTFNPCYLINNRLKTFVNLYSSFKAPTLYQLFDPFAGNKNLQPERSSTIEPGVEYFLNAEFRTRLVYFYRKAKDVIQYQLVDPGFFIYQYRNVSQQKSQGIESEASYKTKKWQVDGNYAYVSGKTISGYDEAGAPLGKDTTYDNLYRIPKHVINFSVGRYFNKFFARAQVKTVSKRLEPVFASAPKTLNSYYTVDLYADYSVKKTKFFVDLQNITNQRYFDILGYNSKRFNFMAGLNFNL